MQTVQDKSCCSTQMLVEDPKLGAEWPLIKGQEQNPDRISAIIVIQREVGQSLKAIPPLQITYKIVCDQK